MIDRQTCALYAKLNVHVRKVGKTTKLVQEMLSIVKNPYIAFSCGKDSSVLADIVLQLNPRVKLRFISSGETRILHNVDDVISHFQRKYNADVEEINFDRVFSEEWKDASFDEQRKAGRRDIQTIDNSQYDGVFMGLRIEESRGRSISLKMHQSSGLPKYMYQYVDKKYYRMCPLADWKTEDVGAYIVSHGLPVLDWYNSFGFNARTTARLTGDAVRQNAIFWIKCNNPQGFSKLIERFPELNVYG